MIDKEFNKKKINKIKKKLFNLLKDNFSEWMFKSLKNENINRNHVK